MTNDGIPTQPVPLQAIHPYLSVVVLECTGESPEQAFENLSEFLAKPPRRQANREVRLISCTRWMPGDPINAQGMEKLNLERIGDLAAFVWHQIPSPSWADEEAGYFDQIHNLTVAVRDERFVAIHCDDTTARRLQRWLNKPPLPSWRRIGPIILENALLRGEVKGLWLRGTHKRRSTKPDAKNISGTRLQDALDASHDSSFALSSARAELEPSPDRVAFTGKVGTSPGKSSIWSSRPMADFNHYLTAVTELLDLIRDTISGGLAVTSPIPILTQQTSSLAGISNAYAVTILTPDDLLSFTHVDEAALEENELLQRASLTPRGLPNSPDFILDVDLDGVEGGSLFVHPEPVNDIHVLEMDLYGEPTDITRVAPVRDALVQDGLITVHYESGHVFTGGMFYSAPTTRSRFSNWEFYDFSGYHIDKEKPEVEKGYSIHEAIGMRGDKSLFAWVIQHYNTGWLLCDDGAGEVADFIHIARDGTLSLIHVKGADNDRDGRSIAVVPYERVVGQAVKNVLYADPALLIPALTSRQQGRACWYNGVRTDERDSFINALALRDAASRVEIHIVQPHVSQEKYHKVRRTISSASGPSGDLLRLHLLEKLLAGARSNVIGSCDDLVVIGSLR